MTLLLLLLISFLLWRHAPVAVVTSQLPQGGEWNRRLLIIASWTPWYRSSVCRIFIASCVFQFVCVPYLANVINLQESSRKKMNSGGGATYVFVMHVVLLITGENTARILITCVPFRLHHQWFMLRVESVGHVYPTQTYLYQAAGSGRVCYRQSDLLKNLKTIVPTPIQSRYLYRRL